MSFLKEVYPSQNDTKNLGNKSIILDKSNDIYKDNDFGILALNQPFAAGPFHVNHFVCFFKKPVGWDFNKETGLLFNNFKKYFDNDLTKVSIHEKKWKNKNIASFDFKVAPINPHKDIVSIEKWSDSNTVIGTTLYDNRQEGGVEFILEGFNHIMTGMMNDIHFLSGRRSWKFGKVIPDNPFDDYYFFETAAFEKFSLEFYNNLDGNNPPVLRTLVNATWISMLKKFGAKENIELLEVHENFDEPTYPFDGMHNYSRDVRRMSNNMESSVYYRNGSFDKIEELGEKNDWFYDVMERHSGLYLHNMPKHNV
ncbi:MAG: hypothetical protein GYB35_14845 [Algicola sp.]|nr:hypothetical protein [Algicola sp.]